MLSKYEDCPLHKDLEPTSPNCKKCEFYKHDMNECKILYARDRASSIIGCSYIRSSPDDIAFEIIDMLVNKRIIKENKSRHCIIST